MRRINLIKTGIVAAVLIIGLVGFLFTRKSETQTINPNKTPETILEGKSEVAGYKSWTKVNDKPQYMAPRVSAMCAAPTKAQIDKEKSNPHLEKFINVYVNSTGKDEMLTKKNPKFPVGTVIVKEKLSSPDSQTPELLTVMIKREKGFKPEVGDWEFMTVDGEATKVTSRGKLENCKACHLDYEQNDFVTRKYLPDSFRQKLR